MKRIVPVLRQSLQRLSHLFTLIATRWKSTFYLYLAAVFSLLIVADAAFLHATANMRQAAFDMMVRYRIFVPPPDKDIVIVDINEASLASMAKEYGRWPWPRQVLGEFLQHLEDQRPKAVVFDILFSDPDVYNPDSDAYFDAAVSETTNTFFPLLRLDEAADALSKVKPAMIPGVTPITGEAEEGATIAVVLPHFRSILKGGRLGFHNIYPDPDGIVREYLIYRDDYGWRIPSLPARVIRELGYREPAAQRVLLNWRGKPFSYHTVGFSDVFNDMLSKSKKRPPDEFAHKTVLIGSTAPSLFDIKPTPMSRLHPGLEILATAIDNLSRGDYLRYPEGRALYPLLSLLIVWATAWAFYRNVGRGQIDRLFGAWQFVLLGVSYASINLTNTYINLTGPVTLGLVYFTVARIYAAVSSDVLETSVLRASMEGEGELGAFLLLIRVDGPERGVAEGMLEGIRQRLEKTGREPKSMEMLRGRQKGIWALLENTLAIAWVTPAREQASRDRVKRDIETITASLAATAPRDGDTGGPVATWVVQEGRISGGKVARAEWGALFAEALLRWHQASAREGETTA